MKRSNQATMPGRGKLKGALLRRSALSGLIGVLAAAGPAAAQMQIKASVAADSTARTVVDVSPTMLDYSISGGTVKGPNLFHSFSTFSVPTGGSATFLDPGVPVANVISRVTGASASVIDGLLKSKVGVQGNFRGADFYFINPNGVTFNANASIDVTGGFYLSTADELRFDGGDVVSSDGSTGSTFSTSLPKEFGFLGQSIGELTLRGTDIGDSDRSSPIVLIGGDIRIETAGGQNGADLRTGRALLAIVALDGPAQVSLLMPTVVPGVQYGAIDLVDTDPNEPGRVTIRAITDNDNRRGAIRIIGNTINFNGAVVETASSAGAAGDVLIAGNALKIENSSISSSASGDQPAGRIEIIGESALVVAESAVSSSTTGSENATASEVSLAAPNITLTDAIISSTSTTAADAGNITIAATNRLAIAGTRLSSASSSNAIDGGSAGFVTLQGDGDIALEITSTAANASAITATTASLNSAATPSSIIIDGFKTISITGVSPIIRSTVSTSTTGAAPAGSITISNTVAGGVVESITLDSAEISSETSGLGVAQAINLAAMQLITAKNGTVVSSRTTSGGAAGNVFVSADSVYLETGSTISSTSGANDVGSGPPTLATTTGDVEVKARLLVIDGVANGIPANINSSSLTFGGAPAGAVKINASESVTLLAGGRLLATTESTQNAGSLLVTTPRLTVQGLASTPLISTFTNGQGLASGIYAGSTSLGNGGVVDIDANIVELLDGGVLQVSATSFGNGGLIRACCAGDASFRISGDGSGLFASTAPGSTGDAGAIGIAAGRFVLEDGGRITVASAGLGAGGRIGIKSRNFLVSGRENVSPSDQTAINTLVTGAAAASSAGAGEITVLAGSLIVNNGAFINTDSSGANPAGNIVFRIGEGNVRGRNTRISSTALTGSQGDAGRIEIGAVNLLIESGAVTTNSQSGSGGEVVIDVDRRLTLTNGQITTNVQGSQSNSNAGNISIGVEQLRDVALDTDICLARCQAFDPFRDVRGPDPADTRLDIFVNSGGGVMANANQGNGGRVRIDVDFIVNNGDIEGEIEATSLGGLDGEVEENGQEFIPPDLTLVPIDKFEAPCAAKREGVSNFKVETAGRRGPSPTDIAPAFYGEAASANIETAQRTGGCLAALN